MKPSWPLPQSLCCCPGATPPAPLCRELPKAALRYCSTNCHDFDLHEIMATAYCIKLLLQLASHQLRSVTCYVVWLHWPCQSYLLAATWSGYVELTPLSHAKWGDLTKMYLHVKFPAASFLHMFLIVLHCWHTVAPSEASNSFESADVR